MITSNGSKPIHYHSLSMGSNSNPQQQAAMMMMSHQRQAPPGHNYSPTHSISGASQHSGNYGHSQLVYENLDYYGGDNGNG